MDTYYDNKQLIEDIEIIINAKQKELQHLMEDPIQDINKSIKINQLQYEISELTMQKQFHENYIADMMINRCKECNCCCNY